MKRKRGYNSDLRAQQAAATRELIIRTAGESFVPWSTDVPFDQLAERAGVSVRTVFRHFPTQRDLIAAVAPYLEQRCGWQPEQMTADNLAAMARSTFAYFGDLLKRGGRDSDPMPAALRDIRAHRTSAIERALGPLTEGMDPEAVRGVLSVISGLTRIQFLRGMHEQWGLDGEAAGKAVEWAVNVLLAELRERQKQCSQRKTSQARPRKRS